jgi:hypothetical protein
MMPNAQYPAILQDNPNYDYSETMMDGVVRSNPDVGPSISRPRFTRTRISATLTIWVDRAQYLAFVDFYNIDLSQGTLPFDWLKPISGAPVTFKFKAPPTITSVGPLTWSVSCQLDEV